MTQDMDAPKCQKCGIEITSGLMAAMCPYREHCEFWPDDEESQEFLDALNMRYVPPDQPAAERAAFEAWLMAEQMLDGTLNPKRNRYDEFPCHLAFKAWQARATVSTAAPAGESLRDALDLAEARLEQMKADRAQALRWRDALNKIAERTSSDDPCRHVVQIARDALRTER